MEYLLEIFRNRAERFHISQFILRSPPHSRIACILPLSIRDYDAKLRRTVRSLLYQVIGLFMLMIPWLLCFLMVKAFPTALAYFVHVIFFRLHKMKALRQRVVQSLLKIQLHIEPLINLAVSQLLCGTYESSLPAEKNQLLFPGLYGHLFIRIGHHLRGKFFITRLQAEIDIRHGVFIKAERQNHADVVEKMEKLKEEGKTKSATYRQLMGTKMNYQNMLSLYKIYGLIED